MIYDTLENARLYKGMNPHLDKAIEFMLTQDLDALPMGRTEIDGSNVFCNKMVKMYSGMVVPKSLSMACFMTQSSLNT